MPKLESLEPLLVDELRDLLDAEGQLVKALPKMAKAASSPELRSAFEEHLQVTEGHVERLNRAFESLGAPARPRKCKGMQGLIEEGREHLEEDADESVRDAALIGSAQRVEHYEIAAYGTARTFASQLGHDDVADLLNQTLSEEKGADRKLTEIAESRVNIQAASGEGAATAGREAQAAGRSLRSASVAAERPRRRAQRRSPRAGGSTASRARRKSRGRR